MSCTSSSSWEPQGILGGLKADEIHDIDCVVVDGSGCFRK